MAFRLSIEEDPAAAVQRCGVEELEQAIEQLERGRQTDPVEAVHDARKNLKRTRALLRLVRSDLGGRAYREHNLTLRDIARQLAGTRDAQVMVQTLQALSARYVGQVPAVTFQQLHMRLDEQARAADASLDASIDEQVQALRQARDDVATWPLHNLRWRSLREGLGRAYAEGRANMREARRRPSADALHEWRKRVKDLDYQQRLLRDLWPSVLTAQAEEAHRLSDLLGDDHDLSVLTTVLQSNGSHPDAEADAVLALIEHRRREIQSEAQALGLRLYAESPRAFARRLRRVLRAARDEARAHEHPALVLPAPPEVRIREVQAG